MKIKYVPLKIEKGIHDKLIEISNKIGCSVSALGCTLLKTVGVILLDKGASEEFSCYAEKNGDGVMCRIAAKGVYHYFLSAEPSYLHLNIGLNANDYALCARFVDMYNLRGNASVFKLLFYWFCSLTDEQMRGYRKDLVYFGRRNVCSSEDQFFYLRANTLWEAAYELGEELFARATGEYLYAYHFCPAAKLGETYSAKTECEDD